MKYHSFRKGSANTTDERYLLSTKENKNIPDIFDVMDEDDHQNHPPDELNYRNQLEEEFTHRFDFDTRLSHIAVEQEQEETLFEQLNTHDVLSTVN
jgi:hypothetical protein